MQVKRDDLLAYLKNGLVVSCQALANEPLHSSLIMSKMALAAKLGGAVAIRANGVDDITAIKKEVSLPIVAIVKRDYPDSAIYITPTMKEVEELANLKVEIIAIDATRRPRPRGLQLDDMVAQCRATYPNILLMADCATYDEAVNAEKIGFDLIATTLVGYTDESKGLTLAHNDYAMLKKMVSTLKAPIIAEGGLHTPKDARKVVELGAHAVVVGGAITRPMQITERFIKEMKEIDHHD